MSKLKIKLTSKVWLSAKVPKTLLATLNSIYNGTFYAIKCSFDIVLEYNINVNNY